MSECERVTREARRPPFPRKREAILTFLWHEFVPFKENLPHYWQVFIRENSKNAELRNSRL